MSSLILSLDFELHYGVSDSKDVKQYGKQLSNTPTAIATLLSLFKEFNIHATWATVGLLFAENKEEAIAFSPSIQPTYDNPLLSNYNLLDDLGNSIVEDPIHFALPIIRNIHSIEGQEIATHTFSHYYCLEKGQTYEQFQADVEAAITIAAKKGIGIDSIVFPRNQYAEKHLEICKNLGIKAFRGNESHWMYAPRSRKSESYLRRIARLVDSYIPISGNHIYHLSSHKNAKTPLNISASRFLRPYHPRLKHFESLRLKRITNEMTEAAKTGGVYHLWWHPHNFGSYLNENLTFLQRIFEHFKYLQKHYNMRSLNMKELEKCSR